MWTSAFAIRGGFDEVTLKKALGAFSTATATAWIWQPVRVIRLPVIPPTQVASLIMVALLWLGAQYDLRR